MIASCPRARRATPNPAVIVQVLSASTEDYDRGEKFEANYRFLPSLRAYVLVAQDEVAIEVRSRDDEHAPWVAARYTAGQQVPLPSIGASLDVDTVYREARKNTRSG